MSYIRTEISNNDKEILQKIYEELERITLPTSYRKGSNSGNFHSKKTGTLSQKNARQAVFGMTKFRGKIQESIINKKYPFMMTLFKEFIESHYPEFKFKSVYVNKNTIATKHVDGNTGESLLVGFGDYTGGQTILFLKGEHKFNINTHSLIFNGSEIQHCSLPFEGTRYSLVFFT